MTTRHHISDDLLVGYEAGSLAEGWNLAIATHLALCPACRGRARDAAALGGALLESVPTEEVEDGALDKVMSRIAEAAPVAPSPAVMRDAPAVIPEPLRSYVGGDVDAIAWRRLGLSARHLPLRVADGQTSARLLCIRAGKPVPTHGHRGAELTVVLSGVLIDGDEIFRRGDVEITDDTVVHQPRAGDEADCICLAVTDAPLRFMNIVSRLVQPFLRI